MSAALELIPTIAMAEVTKNKTAQEDKNKNCYWAMEMAFQLHLL